MAYLLIKSLHVVAMVTWIGGMMAASLVLASRAQGGSDGRLQSLAAVRRWDRRVTTPAMFLAWGLGMAMVVQGGWLGARWLTAKLVIAVALSLLHGLLSGSLRRTASSAPGPIEVILRYAAPAAIAGVAVISFLVIAKPM